MTQTPTVWYRGSMTAPTKRRKYDYSPVEIMRECAYCDYECDYLGAWIVKWGMADRWNCPTHGDFWEMTDPMRHRGDQLR